MSSSNLNEEQQAVMKVYEAWKAKATMAQIHQLAAENPTLGNKSIRIQERVSSDNGTNWTTVYDQTINLPDVNPPTPGPVTPIITPTPVPPAPAPAPAPAPTPAPTTEKQIIIGAMTDTSGNENLSDSGIKSFNSLAKKPIGIAYFTHHWFKTVEAFPKAQCDIAKANNAIPFIRMNADEIKSSVVTCSAINSGKYDNELKAYAEAAKSWGGTIYAELGTEVNGNFLAFSNEGSDAYKTMARKVITMFKSIAPNVKFIFHGDYNDLGSHPEQWYAGDDLFEMIGTSMYGQSNGKGCIGSMEANNNAAYTTMQRTGKKPLAILEWGLGTVDDITNTLRDLPVKFPDVKMLLYWNEKGDYDRRIDKTPESLVAYQKGIANTVYVSELGNVPVNPVPEPGPVTPIPPTPAPAPGPQPTGNVDKFGVQMLYPTLQGGTTWFLNNANNDPAKDDDCFSLDGINSKVSLSKSVVNGVTWFTGKASPVNYHSGGNGSTLRFGVYAELGQKGKSQSHTWKEKPQFIGGPKGILNHEFTVYVKATGQIGAGKHMSCALKVCGGKEDLGRSLVETCYPISSSDHVRANVNYEHFPYNPVKGVKEYFSGDYLQDGKIVGLKGVRMVRTATRIEFYLYVSLNPFDASGKPANDWRLKGMWVDTGNSGGAYNGFPCNWRSQVDKLRVDGYTDVSIACMSIREIDPTAKLADNHPLLSTLHEVELGEPTINEGDFDLSIEEAQALGAARGPF